MNLHHYITSLLPIHHYILFGHYYVIINHYYKFIITHYYVIITSLWHREYCVIITLLLRHYCVIIASLLVIYYFVIASLLQNHYYLLLRDYYIIITSLWHMVKLRNDADWGLAALARPYGQGQMEQQCPEGSTAPWTHQVDICNWISLTYP